MLYYKVTTLAVAVAAAVAVAPAYARGDAAKHTDHSAMQQRGTVDTRSAAGVVAGGGIALGSDASRVEANVPAFGGGVGINARDDLRASAPDHNVKMVFSLTTGNYLADVDVQVSDSRGRTVVDGVSDGPWFYAKLPPGNYTAKATYGGKTVTKRFSVGRTGQRTAHFRWPATVEQQVVSRTDVQANQILGTGPQEPQR